MNIAGRADIQAVHPNPTEAERVVLGVQIPRFRRDPFAQETQQLVIGGPMPQWGNIAGVLWNNRQIVLKTDAQVGRKLLQFHNLADIFLHDGRFYQAAHASFEKQPDRAHGQVERAGDLGDGIMRAGIAAINTHLHHHGFYRCNPISNAGFDQDAICKIADGKTLLTRIVGNLKNIPPQENLATGERDRQRAQPGQIVNDAPGLFRADFAGHLRPRR